MSLEEKQKGQGQLWDYYFFQIFLMSSMTRQWYYTSCFYLSPFSLLFKTVQSQRLWADFTEHQGISLECFYRVPLGTFWSRKRVLNLIFCNEFYFFLFVQSAFQSVYTDGSCSLLLQGIPQFNYVAWRNISFHWPYIVLVVFNTCIDTC